MADGAATRPFSEQRRERLLRALRSEGSIRATRMAADLQVSEVTVRRDINQLVEDGLASRVHGGAVLPEPRSTLGNASPPLGAAARRPLTIGMVVPQVKYYWPKVIASARAAADRANVNLLLRCSSYDIRDDYSQIRMLLKTPEVDGVIVAPNVDAPEGPELLAWLDNQQKPVVLAERIPSASLLVTSLEWAASDHVAGAREAVRHLLGLGHQQIGLLVGELSPTTRHLVRGWKEQLIVSGIDPSAQLRSSSLGFNDNGREDRLRQVLDACEKTGTTALLVHDDPAAVALVQYCTDTGVRIPDELSIVAYDDEIASMGNPPVTAVLPPKDYVGRLAVDLMLARVTEGEDRPPHRIVVSPTLNIRQSTGPHKANRAA